jgi:hypothetical protein
MDETALLPSFAAIVFVGLNHFRDETLASHRQ